MTPNSRSRRLVMATAVLACLLVGGPAAYGAAASTQDAAGNEQPATDGGDLARAVSAGSGHEHHHTSGAGVAQADGQGPDGAGSDDGSASGSGDDAGSDGAASAGGEQAGGGQAGGDQSGGEQAGGEQVGAPAAGQDAEGGERAPAEEGSDATGGAGDADGSGSALDVLATDCTGSNLIPHDGFQKAPRCVSTSFGEVAEQDRSPSLLITDAPERVAQGEPFQIQVSTRNLVRDRFLGAAAGGYYKEASLLDGEGLQRGHFHTACRILPNTQEAPDAAPEPAFFEATEDGGGSSTPDTVTIEVPGIEQAGDMQCSSWAGDGSHRLPMMQRADQTPAFDSVRIEVG